MQQINNVNKNLYNSITPLKLAYVLAGQEL